jgi:hypothetical protein
LRQQPTASKPKHHHNNNNNNNNNSNSSRMAAELQITARLNTAEKVNNSF